MQRRALVRWGVFGVGLALSLGTLTPVARSQEAAPLAKAPTIHHKGRSFRIPFSVDPTILPRLREVQLWVSDDLGEHWRMSGHTTPDQPSSTFRARADGEYWFAVRTMDKEGRLFPRDEKQVEPSLKVVVDTVPPRIALASLGRRGSMATVRWELQDEHLDLGSFVLEYQALGAADWRRVPIRRAARIGMARWEAGTAEALKVRATVYDRARNVKEVVVSLPEGLAARPTSADSEDVESSSPITPISSGNVVRREDADGTDDPPPLTEAAASPSPDRKPRERPGPNDPSSGRALVVGSPRFPLQYAVEDAGPEGPAVVELWVTRDGGKTWSRQAEDPDRTSPFPVELDGDGTFGLALVARSASGSGDQPPSPGDPPMTVVEVDTTPPTVQLDPPKVGTGATAGKVSITWQASDPHLGPRPVVLSFRPDRPDAIWQQITDRIENTGRFDWTLPANVPAKFHVRINVFDSLGNRGSAETTETGPVVVDRARPKSRIIGLEPSARKGADGRSRQ